MNQRLGETREEFKRREREYGQQRYIAQLGTEKGYTPRGASVEHVCPMCNVTFSGGPLKVYCSRRCLDRNPSKLEANRKRAAAAYEADKDAWRTRNRLAYRAKHNSPGRRSMPSKCSVIGCDAKPVAKDVCMRCYRAMQRKAGTPWAREGSKSYKARASRHGVPYEPVNRQRVFKRDGWQCGICHEAVDPELGYPHPGSVSLDHIVPMSKGGPHTYENTQCSHLRCNLIKRDKIIDGTPSLPA